MVFRSVKRKDIVMLVKTLDEGLEVAIGAAA